MSDELLGEQFEALLRRLGADRELAGARYAELRHRLASVFEYRRCPHPEDLADQTLDRAARKILDMGSEFVGSDAARFVFGVAFNVARESFRRHSEVPLPDGWDAASPAALEAPDERERACLDRCLDDLPASERDLLLGYHEGEKSARIRRRSQLARERGLSANALRLKIHRLSARLRECLFRCTEEGAPPGAEA